MSNRILFVDDEPNVLEGIKRQLRKKFQVAVANSGEEALEKIKEAGPYAVVVSDMQMPGMNGLEFLQKAQELAPLTVRMMLTGNSDQATVTEAVNRGEVFRFMCKPCPPEDMIALLNDGIEHHRLITAEKELLSNTLTSSVKVLMDVLAIAKPVLFAQAARVRQRIGRLAKECGVDNAWECEVSAMLCHIGCIGMPDSVIAKVLNSQELTDAERNVWATHPQIGHDLIESIPRLNGIAKTLLYQNKQFDGGGFPEQGAGGEEIPIAARLLKVAMDYERAITRWPDTEYAFAELKSRENIYDPAVVEALRKIDDLEGGAVVLPIGITNLPDQGVVFQDILTREGDIAVQRGTELNLTLCQRIKGLYNGRGIREPMWIMVPENVAETIAPHQPAPAESESESATAEAAPA